MLKKPEHIRRLEALADTNINGIRPGGRAPLGAAGADVPLDHILPSGVIAAPAPVRLRVVGVDALEVAVEVFGELEQLVTLCALVSGSACNSVNKTFYVRSGHVKRT